MQSVFVNKHVEDIQINKVTFAHFKLCNDKGLTKDHRVHHKRKTLTFVVRGIIYYLIITCANRRYLYLYFCVHNCSLHRV